jgi:hypothetical protein
VIQTNISTLGFKLWNIKYTLEHDYDSSIGQNNRARDQWFLVYLFLLATRSRNTPAKLPRLFDLVTVLSLSLILLVKRFHIPPLEAGEPFSLDVFAATLDGMPFEGGVEGGMALEADDDDENELLLASGGERLCEVGIGVGFVLSPRGIGRCEDGSRWRDGVDERSTIF